MPPLAPAAPVRMEMPPLQAAPQACAPPCPRRRQARGSGAAAAAHAAATRRAAAGDAARIGPRRNLRTTGAQPAAGRGRAMHAAQPAPQPPAAPMPQAPRRAHGAHARCADAAGTGVAAGDLARRHRRPAERDQRLARRAGKPHGRPALGGRQARREPAGAALFRSLLDAGFSTAGPHAGRAHARGLDADAALAWARNELVTHLPVLGSEDTLPERRRVCAGRSHRRGQDHHPGEAGRALRRARGRPGRHADDGQFPDRRAGAVADLRPPHGRAHAFGATPASCVACWPSWAAARSC